MTDFTAYLQNKLLEHTFKATAYSAPAAVYAALFNGDPQGAGSEVTTTIRVAGRVAITFGAASGGVVTNSADVDFGNAAGGATVTYVGIYDASTAGNLLASKSVGTNVIVTSVSVKLLSGALSVTLA